MNRTLFRGFLYVSIFIFALSAIMDLILWLENGYRVPSYAISILAFAYVAILAVFIQLERLI